MDLPLLSPPWTTVGKRIESTVRKGLYDFQMLPQEGALALALSGGKDSLTLLCMLKAILGRGFPLLQLYAIHVGGGFTCGAGVSVPFLQRICDELEVPLILREMHQKLEDLECYSCSRQRRSLLFAAAREVGATTIAFGHHRDDNIQTLLMNLLHKAEFAGTLPKLEMVDYGVTIIRPLIYVAENDIKSFARQQNFLRISCKCPVGANSMRLRVNGLIDEMEALYPHARENIAKAILMYGSDKAVRRNPSP
jgi:tRNA 2-thiocytidine biosynthesis protein TtcA